MIAILNERADRLCLNGNPPAISWITLASKSSVPDHYSVSRFEIKEGRHDTRSYSNVRIGKLIRHFPTFVRTGSANAEIHVRISHLGERRGDRTDSTAYLPGMFLDEDVDIGGNLAGLLPVNRVPDTWIHYESRAFDSFL
jgi:hypothetical protein